MKVLLCNDDLPLTGQLFGRSTMIRKESPNNCVYRALEHLLMRLLCLSRDLPLIASSCQPIQWPLVGAGPRTGGRQKPPTSLQEEGVAPRPVLSYFPT